jgi:hypothetical protein
MSEPQIRIVHRQSYHCRDFNDVTAFHTDRANTVLWWLQEGVEAIKQGPLDHEIRKRVFKGY